MWTVKYGVDQIYALAARIMTGGGPVKMQRGLRNGRKQQLDELGFLKDLETCIHDPVGFEYLSRFIEQQLSPEIVCFLKIYLQFERCMFDKERLMIGRKLINTCFTIGQPF